MSKDKTNAIGWGIVLPLFIACKFAGPCAAWSWWWLFLPMIPILTEIVKWAIK